MAIKASDILKRANITLQDAGYVRWTLPELLWYLNDAMRELALHKPNAVTKTVELALEKGTVQTLDDAYISLVRVVRNLVTLSGSADGRTGGKAITVTKRGSLDSVMPEWQNPAVLPYTVQVEHFVQDMADPRTFYVIPGNDGTGVVEAVVSILPVEVDAPAAPLDIASYDAIELDAPAIFRNALADYVVYRAYTKDSADPSQAQRATAHYNLFAQAIGLKTTSDQSTQLKTTPQTS